MYNDELVVRGAHDKFPDFFRMSTFIDSILIHHIYIYIYISAIFHILHINIRKRFFYSNPFRKEPQISYSVGSQKSEKQDFLLSYQTSERLSGYFTFPSLFLRLYTLIRYCLFMK